MRPSFIVRPPSHACHATARTPSHQSGNFLNHQTSIGIDHTMSSTPWSRRVFTRPAISIFYSVDVLFRSSSRWPHRYGPHQQNSNRPAPIDCDGIYKIASLAMVLSPNHQQHCDVFLISSRRDGRNIKMWHDVAEPLTTDYGYIIREFYLSQTTNDIFVIYKLNFRVLVVNISVAE